MVNVGIVGFGFMGRTHLECYRGNAKCQVRRVVTRDPIRREGGPLAKGHLPFGVSELSVDGIAFCDTWQEVVADPEIELVDICTPTDTHCEIALAALAAGKHVFVEKPMARTLAQAKEMAAAASSAGRLLHVGHVLRYWGQYVETQYLVERGELGELRYGRFVRESGRPAWSANDWMLDGGKSGGVILDTHVLDIDAALMICGRPEGIAATGRIANGLPVSIEATWSYDNGAQVQLHGRWDRQIGYPLRYAFSLEFDRGTVYCDSIQGAAVMIVEGGSTSPLRFRAHRPIRRRLTMLSAPSQAGGRRRG